MPDYPHLRIESNPDGVRTITLDPADKLNAVNSRHAALPFYIDEESALSCQRRRENVSAGRSKTASPRGAKCPTGRLFAARQTG